MERACRRSRARAVAKPEAARFLGSPDSPALVSRPMRLDFDRLRPSDASVNPAEAPHPSAAGLRIAVTLALMAGGCHGACHPPESHLKPRVWPNLFAERRAVERETLAAGLHLGRLHCRRSCRGGSDQVGPPGLAGRRHSLLRHDDGGSCRNCRDSGGLCGFPRKGFRNRNGKRRGGKDRRNGFA